MAGYRYWNILIVVLLGVLPGLAYSQYADINFGVAHINECVYEVIVPKPLNDPLTYEKPLPMELLPFQFRNDKYLSIGTAFACSKTEFATAAHVMNFWVRSQIKEIFIRDIKGNVFSVDKIVKFSSRRDFVVFTVKGRQPAEYLEANLTPEISERVYAVGNALGQGVVIRDGLYTSNTPEEVDGKWNWIRFSAAASPGNSGGPLLDKNGKVVGLILGSSPNENLNSALPYSEVNKDYENHAEIYHKMTCALEIFDFVKTVTLDSKIELPQAYDDFRTAYTAKVNDFNNKLRADLLAENIADTFPNGSGSNKVMYTSSPNPFPHLITRRQDGNWELGRPQNIQKAELDNNGHIAHGKFKSTGFARIEKPDNVSLKDLCSNSKLFIDFMLKAVSMTRTVGPEKIRITSLGKADKEYNHQDAYGRKWLVRIWPIEHADQLVAAFILPVPNGCVVMTKIGQTGVILDDYIEDLKILANFVNVAYGGTFKQWLEFLEMKDLIPSALATIEMNLSGAVFNYKSNRFGANCDSNAMNISDNSFLVLGFGFYKDKNITVWDVSKLILWEGKFEKTGFMVARHIRPIDSDDKYSDVWLRLVDGKKPFDKQILIKDNNTSIATVSKNHAITTENRDCAMLYDLSYHKTGIIDQKEMEAGLDKFIKSFKVYEN